jgi:hypothetical protein
LNEKYLSRNLLNTLTVCSCVIVLNLKKSNYHNSYTYLLGF